MKPLTVYLANDGTQFSTEEKALAHEALLVRISEAVKPLGKLPKKVEDGKGWLQHSEASYRAAHRALVKLALPLFKGLNNLYEAAKNNPDSVHPLGVAGRVLDDSSSPIGGGWSRLSCTDKQFREHQQPYFAINGPDKDHVCVEDRS